ncbi:MAG: DUF1611 domain-containing protein, partial [Cyanobacteria bacterium J06573_2]
GVPIPPLAEVVKLYEMVATAAGAFASVPIAGIALNTRNSDETTAKQAILQIESETGLPCTDVIRFGGDKLLDAVMSNE